MMRALDYPPIWLALFLGLAKLLSWTLPLGGFGAAGLALGATLMIAGLALMLAAAYQFYRHRTTIVPHRVAETLITGGVYRRSRNPIYLADAIFLLGAILYWNSAISLPLVWGFARLVEVRFIEPEEQRLADKFGATFGAYKKRVRRWI